MKRVKYTYYCNICKEEIKGYPTEYEIPSIGVNINGGKYIGTERVHFCDDCSKKIIDFIDSITNDVDIPEGDMEEDEDCFE